MAEDYLRRILSVIQPKEIGSTYRSHSGGVQQSSAVFHTTVYALGSLSEDNKVYLKHVMCICPMCMHAVSCQDTTKTQL